MDLYLHATHAPSRRSRGQHNTVCGSFLAIFYLYFPGQLTLDQQLIGPIHFESFLLTMDPANGLLSAKNEIKETSNLSM